MAPPSQTFTAELLGATAKSLEIKHLGTEVVIPRCDIESAEPVGGKVLLTLSYAVYQEMFGEDDQVINRF